MNFNKNMGEGKEKREKRRKKKEEDKYSFFHFSFFILLSSFVRPLAIFVFMIMLAAPVFGQLSQQQQRQPWWLTLEQGKLNFRAGKYGDALMQFEDARRQRRAYYEQLERDLIHLLSEREARRIGDALDRIERFAKDQYYSRAAAALEELYYRVPKNSLNNSAKKALEELGKLKDYPEAEYWIGEVYRAEGEFPLALTQYRRALSMRGLLEDPGFASNLQYRIGEVLSVMPASQTVSTPDYNEMVKAYMSIIEEYDTLWINSEKAAETRRENERIQTSSSARTPPVPYAQASASFATTAMTRTLTIEGIGRFLELYRYGNRIVENAHRQLGFFYAATGVPSAEKHLMYAFLIQNTIIIEEITRRQFDFTISEPNPSRRIRSSARELLLIGEEINKYANLANYAEEVEYYKTAYYLGLSLYRNNRDNSRNIAITIWEFLAAQSSAGEWQSRAARQLQRFQDEPLIRERRN